MGTDQTLMAADMTQTRPDHVMQNVRTQVGLDCSHCAYGGRLAHAARRRTTSDLDR
jgi:hypothetical protein